jgi:DNA-binding CsgD family transcriptional regulator
MVSYVRGRTARTLSDAEIVLAYLAGGSSSDISLAANCTADTVLDLVRRAGHPTRPRGARPRKPLTLTDAEICKLYQMDGLSGPTIADRCQTSPVTIYSILQANNIPRRPCGEVSRAMHDAIRARTRKPPP